jgi:mycothiol synthase
MVEIRPYQAGDLAALIELVREPEMASEFDVLQAPQAVEGWIADPFRDPALHLMAWEDGRLVGFASLFAPPGREGRFTVLRIGVRGVSRRRGIGAALLARASSGGAERHADARELCVSAWLPNPEAAAFSARHGFHRVRSYWLMERPRGTAAPPAWPAGIRIAGPEDSERTYRDFTAAYNDSFEHHYHSVLVSTSDTRTFLTRPGSRPDGYVLAYRGEECVGFCRCEFHEERGEIAVVGTIQAARGIGLGRALLRWGIEWLEREGAARVTLLVDGENENALRLYRSERFEVVRTRESWGRPVLSGVSA